MPAVRIRQIRTAVVHTLGMRQLASEIYRLTTLDLEPDVLIRRGHSQLLASSGPHSPKLPASCRAAREAAIA